MGACYPMCIDGEASDSAVTIPEDRFGLATGFDAQGSVERCQSAERFGSIEISGRIM